MGKGRYATYASSKSSLKARTTKAARTAARSSAGATAGRLRYSVPATSVTSLRASSGVSKKR